MVAADARTAITFALSPGQASDALEGRELLAGIGPLPAPLHLIMDRAYEDNDTLQLALGFGFIPVVPPKSNRLQPWQYDKAMYRKRNEIERLFRRLKGFRRIFFGVPSVGGRYSVLSNFGMVPLAATGHDPQAFLEAARIMARACGPEVADAENPGVALGLTIGVLARH